MTEKYIHADWLLETEAARRLYHDYAKGLPIIDYHCHLPPAEVAGDKRWETVTQVWLHGDHYKWRAMRANGVEERLCTGDASDREKFDAWAATVPWLVRNQLYPWTHLELARYFNIDDALFDPGTADAVWERANARLTEDWFSARGIMERFKVALVCTTDDPNDSLEHHRAVAADECVHHPDAAGLAAGPRRWPCEDAVDLQRVGRPARRGSGRGSSSTSRRISMAALSETARLLSREPGAACRTMGWRPFYAVENY